MESSLTNVRERLVHNNELYIINWGKQVNTILSEGIVYEDSLAMEDRHALTLYRSSIKEEEDTADEIEQHDLIKISRAECNQCNKTFNRRYQLVRHTREVHENQRLHQCDTCSRGFTRKWSKDRHTERCHQSNNAKNDEITTYTFPSYTRGYHVYKKHWTPTVGDHDSLVCKAEPNSKYDKTAVVVVLPNNQVTGHVPRNLSSIFTRFLASQGSKIHAEVVGEVIDRGYGLEVPVDYIFDGTSI